MKIAIHKSSRKGYFSEQWILYCSTNQIPFKIVNCYDTDIIRQLDDCDALMWHFSHADEKDFLFAKQMIKAVEEKGLITFPNYQSCWHFDDKIAQKYLFDALHIPTPDSRVFYRKEHALNWIVNESFPKVFKLRSGASSGNVVLVTGKNQAVALIKKTFARGYRQFDRKTGVKDSLSILMSGKGSILQFAKSIGKVFVHSKYEKTKGRERGYVYFQEFLPANDHDIRVIVIGEKAFAIKRLVRKNDFRASGSGNIIYKKDEIDQDCVSNAFEYSKRIEANCLTFDFIYDAGRNPLVVEISFGFSPKAYYACDGYWDSQMNWHPGNYMQEEWMVDLIVEQLKGRKENV